MCGAVNNVCLSVGLFDECMTNFYMLVHLVTALIFSLVIPSNSINTILLLSNILDITQ